MKFPSNAVKVRIFEPQKPKHQQNGEKKDTSEILIDFHQIQIFS